MLSHFHIDSRLETLPFPSTPPSDIPHAARDEPRLSLAHWFVALRLSLKTDFSKRCFDAVKAPEQ